MTGLDFDYTVEGELIAAAVVAQKLMQDEESTNALVEGFVKYTFDEMGGLLPTEVVAMVGDIKRLPPLDPGGVIDEYDMPTESPSES